MNIITIIPRFSRYFYIKCILDRLVEKIKHDEDNLKAFSKG